ncbi:hypothetical protein D9V32_00875 [Mycetocola tolaasinivorans]|uniref:Leucine-rich repeat domain-containing protein n=1 Tax=Mycetocola tolaasinivorans TaxID=76635 RepID=A0A3L7ADY0_9MICO|nr:hypothetical protein [Mycetocola tolaasinivorans]RLP77918.1 hypothetical protein D9V32_00875 [Mycetocola tolaasinivorans]
MAESTAESAASHEVAPLLDLSARSEFTLDASVNGVERLLLPPNLTHLTLRGFESGSAYVSVDDLVGGLSGLGAIGIPVTEVEAREAGRDLAVRVVGGMPALDGLENVTELRVEGIAMLDLDDVVDSFPSLTLLELSGESSAPGELIETHSLAELPALESLTLRHLHGFTAEDFPEAAALPALAEVNLEGVPAGVADELRSRYPHARIVEGEGR